LSLLLNTHKQGFHVLPYH